MLVWWIRCFNVIGLVYVFIEGINFIIELFKFNFFFCFKSNIENVVNCLEIEVILKMFFVVIGRFFFIEVKLIVFLYVILLLKLVIYVKLGIFGENFFNNCLINVCVFLLYVLFILIIFFFFWMVRNIIKNIIYIKC